MKVLRILVAVVIITGGLAYQNIVLASEEMKEKVKINPPGLAAFAVSRVIDSYIKIRTKDGIFQFKDDTTGQVRNLEFTRTLSTVKETESGYFQCVEFKDTDTGELLDIDVEISNNNGVLAATGAIIHKVGAASRFNYDENNNRVAVTPVPAVENAENAPAQENKPAQGYGY